MATHRLHVSLLRFVEFSIAIHTGSQFNFITPCSIVAEMKLIGLLPEPISQSEHALHNNLMWHTNLIIEKWVVQLVLFAKNQSKQIATAMSSKRSQSYRSFAQD